MKHIGYTYVALIAVLLGIFFSGCDEKENELLRWRIDNEQAFKSYRSNNEYKSKEVDGNSGTVLMKWLEHGKGSVNPVSTGRLYIHYQCYYLVNPPGSLIDGNYNREEPKLISLHRDKQTSIEGLCIALQNMVQGDEAEIIIPWYMAYGDAGSQALGIRPFSALRYIVRLDSIIPEDAVL